MNKFNCEKQKNEEKDNPLQKCGLKIFQNRILLKDFKFRISYGKGMNCFLKRIKAADVYWSSH